MELNDFISLKTKLQTNVWSKKQKERVSEKGPQVQGTMLMLCELEKQRDQTQKLNYKAISPPETIWKEYGNNKRKKKKMKPFPTSLEK